MSFIYAYVDGAYLRETAKELGADPPWLDPFKLCTDCSPGVPRKHELIMGTIARLNFYDAFDEKEKSDEADAMRRYLDAIDGIDDCSVRTGELVSGRRRRQKGVDIHLAVDMLTDAHAKNFEYALLLSGDADFVPLVDQVRRLGRAVVVIAHPPTLADSLKAAADRVWPIREDYLDRWSMTI